MLPSLITIHLWLETNKQKSDDYGYHSSQRISFHEKHIRKTILNKYQKIVIGNSKTRVYNNCELTAGVAAIEHGDAFKLDPHQQQADWLVWDVALQQLTIVTHISSLAWYRHTLKTDRGQCHQQTLGKLELKGKNTQKLNCYVRHSREILTKSMICHDFVMFS